MQSDGSFRTTAAFDGRHRSFAITYQATWLEGCYIARFDFCGIETTNLKRLWEEELYLPAVAVGVRVVGTGVFGSE